MAHSEKHRPRHFDYRLDALPLSKSMALTGACTSTTAYVLVNSGRVIVDGVKAVCPHQQCTAKQTVSVDGVPLPPRAAVVFYLLYKPRKVTSTCKLGPHNRVGPIVTDFTPRLPRVSPIGRLDYESDGLILLTNDGSFQRLVTSPDFALEKTYRVLVESRRYPHFKETPSTEDLEAMVAGIPQHSKNSSDERVKALRVTLIDSHHGRCLLDVTLTEGKKHEVRRLVTAQNFRTLQLTRIRIGGIEGPVDVATTALEAVERLQQAYPSSPTLAAIGKIQPPLKGMLPIDGGGGGDPLKEAVNIVSRGATMRPGDMRIVGQDEVDAMFCCAAPPAATTEL